MDLGPRREQGAASHFAMRMIFPRTESGPDEIARHQAMLDEIVATNSPYPEKRFSGRGIVICGGGETYFACAWVCIGMLRRLGCVLPIELWYRGRAEMKDRKSTRLNSS